jgi:hypothetical protein
MAHSRLNASRLELTETAKQSFKPYTEKNGLLAVSDYKHSPLSQTSSDSLEDTMENINIDIARGDTPC